LFLPRFAASAIRVNVDDESLQDKQMFDAVLCVVQVAGLGGCGLGRLLFKDKMSDAGVLQG